MRPSRRQARTGTALTILIALILAGAVGLLGPRALEAGYLLLHQDDPVALADHVVRTSLDPAVAQREIEAALAANDPELAASFVELARGQGVAVDTDLLQRVEAANSTMARTSQAAGSFAHGFVTGVPQDAVGLAGTAAGDLFVFGDIRDALREGRRLASGEEADELILGLALVGIAVTAGTYASLGVGAPARLGVSVIKGARKAGRIGSRLADEISRSLRSAVDLSALKTAVSPVSLAQPATAVRAAREAVKLERAGGLVRLMEDTGRVQAKAGTRAAMDIRLSPTATSGSVRPCSWTFTSVAIFGSHNRCQSSSDFSLTMRPVPATWRRLAGATGSFAPIVRRRESRSASQIVLASCAAASAAVTPD